MNILTDFPNWFPFLCIIGAAIYAVALYSKDRQNKSLKASLRLVLSILRFTLVFFLLIFLLRPLTQSIEKSIEKPIIIIAQDRSASIVLGPDSTYMKESYPSELLNFSRGFSDQYDLRYFGFGDAVSEGLDTLYFDEKSTNLSEMQEAIYNRFSNRNVGAIILASDGLYNQGQNPLYAFKKLNAPIYSIALGDTNEKRDALINDIRHNRLAYLGNSFPVEISVEGNKLKGEKGFLKITKAGETLHNQAFSFESDQASQVFNFQLNAVQPGLQRYDVKITQFKNELTTANNQSSFFIDVLDNRQKMLLLAAEPHPDIAAIKNSLQHFENYELVVKMASDGVFDTKDYSLIILHQLPLYPNTKWDIKKLLAGPTPVLLILGSQSHIHSFNALETGIQIKEAGRQRIQNISGHAEKDFPLFKLSEPAARFIERAPPLQVPMGTMQYSPGIQSLISQRIGGIDTPYPLLTFNRVQENKIGLLLGEGFWRWRLMDYAQNGHHQASDEILSKTVQYLATKEDKSLFRVSTATNISEKDALIFNSELYNESYEVISDAEIAMQISNESGEVFNYIFNQNGNSYTLNAGRMPVGKYSYKAAVMLGNKTLIKTGGFSISPIQLEMLKSTANHSLMYQLAAENGGKMFYPGQWNELTKTIEERPEIVAITRQTNLLTELINQRWILLLLMGLLSMEWLLRKRAGIY